MMLLFLFRLMEKQALQFLVLLLFLQAFHGQAQSRISDVSSYESSDCQTLVLHRAHAPHHLTVDSIGHLFGISKLTIDRAKNLANENTQLVNGQFSLIPITCGCRGNVCEASVDYQISRDDTSSSSVYNRKLQSLRNYQAMQEANPELDVVIPSKCRCPTRVQIKDGITMVITYIVHEGDTMANISRMFSVDFQDLVSENGAEGLNVSSAIFIPVAWKRLPSQPVNHVFPPVAHVGKLDNVVLLGLSMAVVGMLAVGLSLEIRQKYERLPKADKQSPCIELLQTFNRNVSVDEKKPIMYSPKVVKKATQNRNVIVDENKAIMYSPKVVKKATQNFSPLFHIGGSVYRGIINGRHVAIKRIKGDIAPQDLMSLNHENLVRLEGFCIGEGKSYLIYEYVENKSLDLWLHSRNNRSSVGYCTSLTWRMRLQIAVDVARGLQHIHYHTTHKNLKCSNILLDRKLRAKVGDFGMTEYGRNAETQHTKEGTEGYMAPEYIARGGLITPKLDVFAFGVMLLQLISGKQAIVRDERRNPRLLWTQIKGLLEGEDREEKLRDWIDPDLQNTYHIDSVLSLAMIARACIAEDERARPNMGEVAYRISKHLDMCFEYSES